MGAVALPGGQIDSGNREFRGTSPKLRRWLLFAEGRSFGGQNLVFRSTDVAANPVFVDGIDYDFIAQFIASDEELHGLVGCAIFFLETVVVNLNGDAIFVILRICSQQRKLQICDALERLL